MRKHYKSTIYPVSFRPKNRERCITGEASHYTSTCTNIARLALTGLLFIIMSLWHMNRPLQAQTIQTIEGHGFEEGTVPFVCSCCGGQHADKTDKDESPVISAMFDPFAKWYGNEEVRLMIRVRDDDVKEIRWENTVFQRFGEPLDTIILLDDGTQGDDIGGDNIFTVDGISRIPTNEPFPTGPAPTWVYQLNLTLVYKDGTEKAIIQNRVILISLDPAVIPRASVYRGELGDFIDHTEYVIGIIGPTTNRMEIAQQYYQVMEDDRDFLFIANPPDGRSPGAGFFTHVKNTVQGIGVSEVDFTASYGSAGRLTGVVSLLPSANFLLLNHEILHQWASFMASSLNLGRASHWDVIDRPSTGFGASGHGVFSQLEHIEENRYRGIQFNWRDQQAKAFNDFELYLMGLIDISEVESPIRTLVNPTWLETEVDIENTIIYRNFESEGIREVTTEEILAVHGLRSPGPDEAQTSFSGGMVVVHHRPLTLAEFSYYDFKMREYEKPDSELIPSNLTFEAATGGLADMTTRLFAPIIPNPVTLLTPEPNEHHPGHSVSFSWERLSGVDHYHIQVALDAAFSDMVAENQLVTGSQKVIDTFDHDTVYYWRVRAENEAGAGEWSETWSFQTYSTLYTGDPIEGILRVFPNPATNHITVEYAGHDPITQIVVYDLLGQAHVRKEGLAGPVVQVDLAHLDAGIYILHVLTATQKSVTKIQVAR